MEPESITNKYYIDIILILLISITISFRDNIQQFNVINKLYRHNFFKILLLLILIFTNNFLPILGIPLFLLYLSLNTYIISLPNIKEDEEEDVKEEVNENKEQFSEKKLDGKKIGEFIDKVNEKCKGDNLNSESCRYLMSKYENINKDVLDMIKYNKNGEESSRSEIEQTIEKYKKII